MWSGERILALMIAHDLNCNKVECKPVRWYFSSKMVKSSIREHPMSLGDLPSALL
jgi:hypothetical protein